MTHGAASVVFEDDSSSAVVERVVSIKMQGSWNQKRGHDGLEKGKGVQKRLDN